MELLNLWAMDQGDWVELKFDIRGLAHIFISQFYDKWGLRWAPTESTLCSTSVQGEMHRQGPIKIIAKAIACVGLKNVDHA